jgi:hypothetical protein
VIGDDAELVKAGIQGFAEGTFKPVSDLIQSLFGPAATEAGLLLRDQVKHWRAKRTIRLFEHTKALLAEAKIQPTQVPLKILLPIIDNASIEDEDDLQDIWANLLANAADPRKSDEVVPTFLAILKELSSRDVMFLQALFSQSRERSNKWLTARNVDDIAFEDSDLRSIFANAGLARYHFERGWISNEEAERLDLPAEIRDDVRADVRDIAYSMDLFRRLGVVAKVFEVPIKKGNANIFTLGTKHAFTRLGVCFVEACQAPKP